MILAQRIPQLTEQMRAATLRAAAAHATPVRRAQPSGVTRPEDDLVARLEHLGYSVHLERRVA